MDNNNKTHENKYKDESEENKYKDESEENKYKDESEEEYSYGSEWDPEEVLILVSEDDSDYEPEEFKVCSSIFRIKKPPIIATDTDGNEIEFENSYLASRLLGISNANIIRSCYNLRGYEYIAVDDKKYSFREK